MGRQQIRLDKNSALGIVNYLRTRGMRDIFEHVMAAGRTRDAAILLAMRVIAAFMFVIILLPSPWFLLTASGSPIAGSRILSYALDESFRSLLFFLSPANAFLIFTMPVVITLLSTITLLDVFMNRAKNAAWLSVCNIIATIILLYAAKLVIAPTRHALGGMIALPSWGLWLILLSAVALVILSAVAGSRIERYARLPWRA